MRFLVAFGLSLLMASQAIAQDVPFYNRSNLDQDQDVGALNNNFVEIAPVVGKATSTITPAFCPSGQFLSGAFYYKGLISGGFCTSLTSATVGGLASQAPLTGNGSAISPFGVDSTSVTLQSNIFNAANKLLKLDSSALCGVTNGCTGANLSATGGATSFVRQASVGAVLTVGTIGASDISSVNDSALTSNVALLDRANQVFTGTNTFTSSTTFNSLSGIFIGRGSIVGGNIALRIKKQADASYAVWVTSQDTSVEFSIDKFGHTGIGGGTQFTSDGQTLYVTGTSHQTGAATFASSVTVTGNLLVGGTIAGSAFSGPVLSTSISAGSLGSGVIASSHAVASITTDNQISSNTYTGVVVLSSSILAGNLSPGVAVPDASLTSNVALLNRTNQTFTGVNTFSSSATFTNASGIFIGQSPIVGGNIGLRIKQQAGTAYAVHITSQDTSAQFQLDKFGHVAIGGATQFALEGQTLYLWGTSHQTGAATFVSSATFQSTVDASGYKTSGTAGATTSCTGGQILLNPTFSGGLQTGGSCSSSTGVGDAVLASTQTFTGQDSFYNAITVGSSVTVTGAGGGSGNALYSLSTSTGIIVTAGEVRAPIGTFTQTGQTNYSVYASSGGNFASGEVKAARFNGDGQLITGIARSTAAANIPQATGTNTAFGACIAGSSITLTCANAGPALVTYLGGMASNTYPNAAPELTIEIDGAFPSGHTSGNGLTYGGAAANVAANMSFTFLTASLAAGSHTFCLAARVQAAATWTFFNAGDPGKPEFSAICLAN